MVQAGYKYSPQWHDETTTAVQVPGRVVKKVTIRKVNAGKKLLGKIGIALFIYALLLVFLCIKSATLGYQIVQLENDIKDIQTANERLEYQIAQMTSLERVEEVAINELNMYKPDSNITVAALTADNLLSQDNTNEISQDSEMASANTQGSSLEKLYASLMQLADND